MTILQDLERITKGNTFTHLVLMVLQVVAPGFLFLYLFERQMVMEQSWIKVMLISISLFAPLCFFNYLAVLPAIESVQEDIHWVSLVFSIFFSGLVFYAALFLSFLLKIPTVRVFSYILIGFEVILLMMIYWDSKKKGAGTNASNKK